MKWPQICSFLLLTSSVSCEVFSSTTDIVKLLDTETALILRLQFFISKDEQNILDVKRQIERYQKENQIARKNITDFVSNPLNSFILVKRLLSEWKIVENLWSNETTQDIMRNMTDIKESMTFPTQDDLGGIIYALERIRNTYDIDISSLADGKINGIQFSSQLSAIDCFDIGKKLCDDNDFHNCMLWMTEALNRHEKAPDMSETSRWEILEYIAFSAFQLGDLSKALFFTDEVLKIYPDHPRALGNKAYFVELKKLDEPFDYKLQEDERESRGTSNNDIYKMACRKEISPPVTITSKLKCRYVTNDIPFLRLAPIKEEEAYLKPRIVLFREVLYDSEIETIKILAQAKLETANVRRKNSDSFTYLKNRAGKHAWLKDEVHPVVATVARRVEDMTKLSVVTAEELQVVNYGIGGFFDPHHDYFDPEDEINKYIGNRIATLLFYMNDVAQGGATVFPHLRLGLWPEKGTAAFWFNLLPDGQPDVRTLHAGCPVIAGTKWICNKWLHESDQEFKRPCELKPSNILQKNSQKQK